VFPDTAPPGLLRVAVPADLSTVVDWLEAFARDTLTPAGDTRAKAVELMRDESLWVWDDGVPRSVVAAAAWTPHGVRIGYVYTPPAFRARGYATNAVASLSDRLLRAGRRVCFLYTDLANPTSNAIYARIGYRPVCDVVDVDFSPPGSPLPARRA
jgi:predicted GNAT family acetyltransferase